MTIVAALRRMLPAAVLLPLAACGATQETVVLGDVEAETRAVGGTLSAPGASVGGGVAVVGIAPAPETTGSTPPAVADPAQGLFGPWTMARAGDRVCTIDLGSRNAVGDYTAKTRRCSSIELARIALWTTSGDGIVLYDFERRPVAVLARSAPDLYEGTVAGDMRVTLWR